MKKLVVSLFTILTLTVMASAHFIGAESPLTITLIALWFGMIFPTVIESAN